MLNLVSFKWLMAGKPSINHAPAHGAGNDARVAVYSSTSSMFQGRSAS
jgi:hypothetical protein